MRNSSLSANSSVISQGWIPGPTTRGTWDIIWTCAQTMALCAWVTMCVNVPSPDNVSVDLFRDKLHSSLMALLGPDLIVMLSLMQYQSARDSVEDFKAAGYADWTMVHAFYADMGGVSVKHADWKRLPVNAKQLHYLVVHGYMDYPMISLTEIEGRVKRDGVAK